MWGFRGMVWLNDHGYNRNIGEWNFCVAIEKKFKKISWCLIVSIIGVSSKYFEA